MRFTVIYGSYRRDRRGIRLARFVIDQLKGRGHEVDFIDAKEYPFPILDRMYKEYDDPPEYMEDIAEKLRQSDGFIFVAGEYNHSIQPGLKNLIDHYLEEWYGRPSALVTYSKGRIAGARNIHNMRAILGEIGTLSIPSIFSVQIDEFQEDGSSTEIMEERFSRFAKELEKFASRISRP